MHEESAWRKRKQTYHFANPPVLISTGTVAGPFEGQGPLHADFDEILTDPRNNEKTFEKAERSILTKACQLALDHASCSTAEVDLFLAGDLLNQIISSNFTAVTLGIPFLGLYGACSTAALSLGLGAMLLDGGFAGTVLTSTVSHNSTAKVSTVFPPIRAQRRRTNNGP